MLRRALPARLAPVLCAAVLTGLVGAKAQAAEAAAGSPAAAHLQRANELVGQEQLDAACAELEAAYASSRDPLLWLRIGRLRLRLKQLEAAQAAMQRFLDESKAPHPALKAEAQRALHELSQKNLLPPKPPPPPPPAAQTEGTMSLYHDLRLLPIEFRPQRDKRLLKIGAGLLAGGYLSAVVVSLGLATALDQPDAPSAAANYTLLIPVIGPFVSAIVAPATNDRGNARPLISSWSLPWALTSGLVQVAGFAVLLKGAIPRRVPVLVTKLQLLPYATPSAGGLWAGGTF